MRSSRVEPGYDVVVIGAGPAGCAAAAAFAKRGDSVLLAEAQAAAANRFAGEWIHPSGVAILRKHDLLPANAEEHFGLGFAVFPDDGTEPVRLDYPGGKVALAYEHRAMIGHLRERVRRLSSVDYIEGVRASVLGPDRVALHRRGAQWRHVQTGLVVGAGGRSLAKQSAAQLGKRATNVSKMAGLVLEDVTLPFEGYGHLISGGPGPVLLYRINAKSVRVCLDLPKRITSLRQHWPALAAQFASALPKRLRKAFMLASTSRVEWAANVFRNRDYSQHSDLACIGDAIGTCHPLTAIGITMAVQDVDALATSTSPTAYAHSRQTETHIPELLSNALYQAFVRNDPGAQFIRRAMFEAWRRNPAQRARTMGLLDSGAATPGDFASSFLRVAALAAVDVGRSDPASFTSLAGWMRWPLAAVVPRSWMPSEIATWVEPDNWPESESQKQERLEVTRAV